jgi:hypothetical protein
MQMVTSAPPGTPDGAIYYPIRRHKSTYGVAAPDREMTGKAGATAVVNLIGM